MGRGFRVYFDVPELKEAIRDLHAFDGRQAAKLEDIVSSSTKNITKDARKLAPRETGSLRKSIRSKFDKKEMAGYVMAKKPHAHLVELGAAATKSRPKKAKVLKVDFMGLRRFYPQAKIPKRKANPFMKPAYEKEKPNLINKIKGVYVKP